MGAASVSVLGLLPCAEDQKSLRQIFSHSKWNLRLVGSLAPARVLLEEIVPGIVLSDNRLPDARWQDVLLELQCRRVEPVLIVASRLADDGLWAEVLNLGGYDVLATPFQPSEVIRSVSFAWRHWQDRIVSKGKPLTMAAGSQAWWPDL